MATKISFNSNGVISSRAVQIHYLTAPNLVRYGCGRGMTVGGSTVWTMTNAYTSSGEKKTSIGRGSFMVSAQSLYGYNVGGNGATATFKQQLSEVLNTSHYYYFSCYHGTNSGPTVTISTAQGSTQTIATLPSTSAAYTTDFYSCIFKPTYSQMSYLTFNVPSGVTLYFTRIMLFDLTAMGISVTESNKSTWKTYVDTYLRENRTIVGMGDSSGTSDSYLIYTPGGWASSSDGFTQTDFPERCWTYLIPQGHSQVCFSEKREKVEDVGGMNGKKRFSLLSFPVRGRIQAGPG